MKVRIGFMGTVAMALAICGLSATAQTGAQTATPIAAKSTRPLVIAHRGASGYLPEHTEGAKVLAVAQGADYVEQDVVLSKDKVFVVCHDIQMQETTDVATKFPGRARPDGNYYFADFDWSEIAQLAVNERRDRRGNQAFTGRFDGGFHQHLMRLNDELKLLQGLGKTLGRQIGIYVELKRPAWHRENMQVDMSQLLLEQLATAGYSRPEHKCFVQCFELDELKHLKQDLKCQLPLIALLGGRPRTSSADDQETLAAEMRSIAEYAQGIGPALEMIARRASDSKENLKGNAVSDSKQLGSVESTGVVEAAHSAGLLVHPYTVRQDALVKWAGSIDQLHAVLIDQLKVDGFFSDFPLISRQAVDRK